MLVQSFAILMTSVLSFAGGEFSTREQCTTKELWKKSASLAAPRNATEQAYCMPHVVSWLLEYETGKPVSAMELGFNTHFHHTEIGEQFTPAGVLRIEQILSTVNESGFCLESQAVSTYNSPTYPKNILEAYTEATRDPSLRQKLFPGTTSRSPIRYSHLWEDIRKQIAHNCEPRQRLDHPKWFIFRPATRVKGRNLFQSLDHDKPSAVTFMNKNLFNEETRWPGAHATVLVGRRWNEETNECDYMLRDSGGADCKNFQGTVVEPQFRCENGNMIYGERRLSEVTHETMELRALELDASGTHKQIDPSHVQNHGVIVTQPPAGVK